MREQLLAAGADTERRLLLTGATVLSLDPEVGDFARGDVLIEGERIVAVGPDLGASVGDGAALRLEMDGKIVMPGFVDTHRHCWQNQFRRYMSDARIEEYMVDAHEVFAPVYRPDDIYTGCLLSAWGAIDSGVTCLLDFMHNARSLEHSEAAVEAFVAVGIRGVHGAGPPSKGEWDERWLENVETMRETRFRDDDCISSLMSTVHETGHGRYEQNLPRDWLGQPLANARSMALHESQSLSFEMQLGSHPGFVAHLAPLVAAAFGPHPAYEAGNLHRLLTRVKPGLIRVDADEVTYPAHVILRYEIERPLVEGEDHRDLVAVLIVLVKLFGVGRSLFGLEVVRHLLLDLAHLRARAVRRVDVHIDSGNHDCRSFKLARAS